MKRNNGNRRKLSFQLKISIKIYKNLHFRAPSLVILWQNACYLFWNLAEHAKGTDSLREKWSMQLLRRCLILQKLQRENMWVKVLVRRLLKQPCFLSQLSSSLEERREIKDSANVIININLLLTRRKIALKIWSNALS